jgi:MFS family permease
MRECRARIMPSPTAAPAPTHGAQTLPLGVVVLLAAAILINYIDRGNLATVGPLVQRELHLTNSELGVLLSAFFFTYTPMQLLAGWLAERFDVGRLLVLGLSLWSLATIGMGFVGSLVAVLLLRMLLGLGESVFYPCSSKLLAVRVHSDKLAGANGLISAGQALGPVIGTFVGGLLILRFGWRGLMIATGVLSLTWLIPWLAATRGTRSHAHARSLGPPSYLAIIQERAAWGAALGHFTNNYVLYFVLSWLPSYLINVQGLSVARMTQVGTFVYSIYAVSCILTGRVADRLVRSGRTPNAVYKPIMIASNLGLAVCMLLAAAAPASLAVSLLAIAGVFFGFGTPMLFAIAQTLAGPRAAGQWVGVQNFAGNFAGILAPTITGQIVDRTGSYYWAFAVAGSIALLGAFAWGVVIPRVETVRWPQLAPETP